MKNKKASIVFVALLSLFISTSCIENDKSLGTQFLSSDYLLKLKLDTLSLPLTTRYMDSLQGGSSSHMLVGYLHDDIFKTMTVGSATQVLPTSDSTDFGENPQLLYAYINFQIDSTVYYDNSQLGIAQNIYVYKLLKDLDSTSLLNNAISYKDIDPKPVSVGSSIHFGDDSLKVYLSNEYANELLATTPEEFDSTALFLKRIKGLYISTESPNVVAKQGRLNYLSVGSSYIYLHYILNDSSLGITDLDTVESFSIASKYCVNTFKTESKYLENLTDNNQLYVESLSGVKPYISGIEFRAMMDKWMSDNNLDPKKIVLSRATVKLPYEMPSDYTVVDKEYPTSIYPCSNNIPDSTYTYSPLTEVYSSSATGKINRSKREYIADITTYLQELIRMDIEKINSSKDLWFSPSYSFSDSQGNIYYAIDTQDYKRAIINGPSAERHPTLEIAYVIVGRSN